MPALTCDVCGGKLVMDASREFSRCESCGCEYTVDTMRSMIQALGDVDLNVKGIASVESLIKRARLMCEDGDFNKAQEMIEQALTVDPESGEAYLVALMIDYRCRQEEEVGIYFRDMPQNRNCQKVLRFGDTALKANLEKIVVQGIEVEEFLNREHHDDENATRQPIKWQVIFVDATNNRVLAITKDIISKMPYHQPGGDITWENCTLRSWLNNDFCNTLPAHIESRVAEVVNQNPDNGSVPGGSPTRDRVFLLSIDEC